MANKRRRGHLQAIFGNATAEIVLVEAMRGAIWPAKLAKDYGVPKTPLWKQMKRFIEAEILVAEQTVGTITTYRFNADHEFAGPLLQLLENAASVVTKGRSKK